MGWDVQLRLASLSFGVRSELVWSFVGVSGILLDWCWPFWNRMSSLSLDVLSDTVWFELGRQLGLKLECCIWACLGVSGKGLSELRNLAAKCLSGLGLPSLCWSVWF